MNPRVLFLLWIVGYEYLPDIPLGTLLVGALAIAWLLRKGVTNGRLA